MRLKTQWNGVIGVVSCLVLLITVGCQYKSQTPQHAESVKKEEKVMVQKSPPSTLTQAPIIETKPTAPENIKKTMSTSQCYHFSENSNNLTEETKRALNKQAHYLVAHPSARILLEGHTDFHGHQRHPKLGKTRAQNVAEYLKSQGVTSEQIVLQKNSKKGSISMENCQVELIYQVQK